MTKGTEHHTQASLEGWEEEVVVGGRLKREEIGAY